MKRPSWPEVSGPLQPYAAGYRKELSRRLGYSRWSASAHMYLMADASAWMDTRDLSPAEFDSRRREQFLADRQARGRVTRRTPRGLVPLVGYLRQLGVLPEEVAVVPEEPIEHLVWEFGQYLNAELGLAPRTIVGYQRVARLFLLKCAPEPASPDCGVGRLGVEVINAFLLGECAPVGVASANKLVTALRALLRFFYLGSYTTDSLADCVPQGAAWRDSGRSRALAQRDVERLLSSCDRRTASGRRDFAIVVLLARLGLRASEVAALGLDDLDWRAGEQSSPARVAAGTACRFRRTWAGQWRRTAGVVGRATSTVRCSCRCAPRMAR